MRRTSTATLTTTLLAVVVLGSASACQSSSQVETSESSSAAAPSTAPTSVPTSGRESSPQGVNLSPAEFCGLLSEANLLPLQQQPVQKAPAPIDKEGFPGCDWSLGGPGRHLEMSLFKAPDPKLISETATSTFPVGAAGTGYVSFGSVVGGCNALVRTQDAPAAYFLRYTLESLDDSVKGCSQGIPQVLTVLQGLKW